MCRYLIHLITTNYKLREGRGRAETEQALHNEYYVNCYVKVYIFEMELALICCVPPLNQPSVNPCGQKPVCCDSDLGF